jgi:RNA polymerase sigma factor (TIGR02999 family)
MVAQGSNHGTRCPGSRNRAVSRLSMDDAHNELAIKVYDQLRAIAAGYLSDERNGHTLQPTALVNEAYIRLAEQHRGRYDNTVHFRAIIAMMMRRVLVNHALERGRIKRGKDWKRVPLTVVGELSNSRPIDLIALDEALDRLAMMDPRQSRIVELRFFGGLTIEQTAELLEVSSSTVSREWIGARAWLGAELADKTEAEQPGE